MSKNMVDKKCESTEWGTPKRILEPVRDLFGLARDINPGTGTPFRKIDLDPCTNSQNPTDANRIIVKIDDGLAQPWSRGGQPGYVFVNPPYGKEMYDWIDKVVREAECGNYIVLLLAASSRWDQPRWNRLFSRELTAMVPIHGRVKFIDLETGEERKQNPYPSILFVYNFAWYHVKPALGHLGKAIPIGRPW